MTNTYVHPATERQMDYIKRLRQERDLPQDFVGSRSDAFAEIERLKRMPRIHKHSAADVGMYRTADGTIYKVVNAIHGSGRNYAKRLITGVHPDGTTWAKFEIERGAVYRLQPEDRLSVEDGAEYGKLYGFCVRCAATLTDEISIELGMGPICRQKW